MPVPPGATVTNLEAPFPPADPPLPVFVPPSVMDPVSNLDFPPVDDAFALEMRSETIEQLVGGDALRRGESERIEAGRSQTNADLVTGRGRVRVQDTLHEHTGHGLAEQAAHLHTTVDGTLDVHATSDDAVLLAGHMRELWDGGAAIVAAMTDDTVGGGGIRVTTPLDLWVHGLMGVEERIGTCTADAVLMERSATHYEREYGPGVHAAGLSVHTGSLYLSSRSTFRALMRASSGVRNLIAGGGGGGAGGGAGDAPGASPPPVSAAGGAGTQAASETLCAATGAGGTAQAGVVAGVRSEDLAGIHRGDEAAALDSGANVAGASGDLTGLRRGEDTAGQLAALRDAMRGAEAGTQGEVTSVSRAPKLDDAASVHEASAPDIVADIRPGATVPAMDAPVSHSTVSPPQPPPGVKLGLLGGADRPPQPAAPTSGFCAANHRLCELRNYYYDLRRMDIYRDFKYAHTRATDKVIRQFKKFGVSEAVLARRPPDIPIANHAYRILEKMAGQAKNEGKHLRVAAIRQALESFDEYAVAQLQKLCAKHGIAEAPTTQAMQRPSATAGPTVTVAAGPAPAHTIIHADRITAYRQLRDLERRFWAIGRPDAHADFYEVANGVAQKVTTSFRKFGGEFRDLRLNPSIAPSTEQAYRALQDMVGQADESRDGARAREIRQALNDIDRFISERLDKLTTRYGALDALLTQTAQAMQTPPVTTTTSITTPALSPGAAYPVPSWADDNLAVEPALLAGKLLPRFDALRFVVETGAFEPFGLAEELAAGRLPMQIIDGLIEGYRATDEGDRSARYIEYLRSLKESSKRARLDAFPERVDPPWLDQVRELLRLRGDAAQPSAASATGLAKLEVTKIDRLFGMGDGALHPAPLPPLSAPGRAGVGAEGPPPAADPWRIRAPGMGGEPRPVAFDLWSAPPGPSSQVVHTETIRSPLLSAGAQPGWQGAETPGFARADSGAVEFPFSHRDAIARWIETEDALLDPEAMLGTGGTDAFGDFPTRSPGKLTDHRWIDAMVQAAAAHGSDVDWRAIEELANFL